MLSKAKISLIRSLDDKKFRQKEGLFVIEGEKMLMELAASGWKWEQVFLTENFIQKHPDLYENHIAIEVSDLNKISFLKSSNAGLALVKIPENETFSFGIDGFYVVLDGIRDPGNLGTIIRTLDWFGINQLICSHDTVDFTNPKVIQSSMGSIFRMKIYYEDLSTLFINNKGKRVVFGTDMTGSSIYKTNIKEGFLIIGNESDGIRDKIKPFVSDWITIPQHGSKVESLNASIATAIICAERFRQLTQQ